MMDGVGIKITLSEPEKFLVVKESLTRMGVPSQKTKTLYQTAHILHKRGQYYIVHFKSLFVLDGKTSNISEDDIKRRNLIATLLEDWGLIKIVDRNDLSAGLAPTSSVKILSYKDKDTWETCCKYTIGNRNNH